MSAPIFAVDVDGRAVWANREPYACLPLRVYVSDLALSLKQGWVAGMRHAAMVACVTRARTASAVAHEHARRLL